MLHVVAHMSQFAPWSNTKVEVLSSVKEIPDGGMATTVPYSDMLMLWRKCVVLDHGQPATSLDHVRPPPPTSS